MNEEKKFVEGLYYNEPRERSPEWILGSISIEPKRFTDWMRANYDPNEKYLKIDFKMGKSGKPYAELNTWKPTQGQGQGNGQPHNPSQQSGSSFQESKGTINSTQNEFESDIPF